MSLENKLESMDRTYTMLSEDLNNANLSIEERFPKAGAAVVEYLEGTCEVIEEASRSQNIIVLMQAFISLRNLADGNLMAFVAASEEAGFPVHIEEETQVE